MHLYWGNETLLVTIEKEFPGSTIYWLLVTIGVSIVWVTYLTYYNARVVGSIVTIIANRFIRHGHIKIGKLFFFCFTTVFRQTLLSCPYAVLWPSIQLRPGHPYVRLPAVLILQ